MIVILMGVDGAVAPVTVRTLAAALGWRCAEARDPHVLHATAAAVLGRREHLLVASCGFSPDQQAIVRGDLRNVRFVDLANGPADPDALLRSIRYEFGL